MTHYFYQYAPYGRARKLNVAKLETKCNNCVMNIVPFHENALLDDSPKEICGKVGDETL